MDELKWFLIGGLVLFVLWAMTGGPSRMENKEHPFLEQPAPIESGQPYTLEQLRDRTRP
jgi:hypothetical protein